MTPQRLHRIAAAAAFLAAFGSYLATTYPSLSFWDCGEFIATTHTLGVPHAPGAPFFQLYQKTFSLIPYVQNVARRMNIVSCLAAALTAMLTYLIGVRFIGRFRAAPPGSAGEQLLLSVPALIGALALAWSDTFWFNAIESEVYASSMFMLSLVVWLGLKWYEEADQPHNERYLLLIAYLLGLSIGVHQLSLLAFFGVALLVYFRKYTFSLKGFVIFTGVAAGLFLVIYPGIIVWLPELLDGKITETAEPSVAVQLLPLLFVAAAAIGIVLSHQRRLWFVNVYLTALLLVIAGYSTYTLTLVRAGKHTAINEVNPSNLEVLVTYLNREQYGDNPIFRGPTFDNLSGRVESADPSKTVWFPRRGNPEEGHAAYYKRYKGDGDYFVKYQMYQMWLRYLYWNFIGRAGDVQDAPPYFAGAITDGPEDGLWTLMPHAFPNAYYGIPMLLGLIGIIFHFRRDWKFGMVLLALFAILGFVLAFYFNMAQPQPRERDYFFVGAFFVFALWIAIGSYALVSLLEKRIPGSRLPALAAAGILFLAAPINMVLQNWFDHDHSRDWVPWDLSYNTLQSCDKDAILFTNGDNDTFPLWYLQEVEGVRQDVRIVCLSLLNTDWYSLQLKNERPHGALTVPTDLSDEDIVRLSHFNESSIVETGWKQEKKELSLPVPSDVYRRFASEMPGGAPPDSGRAREIRWMSSSRFPVQDANGNMLYIRQWQDIMVEHILRANKWIRPIYFAVTCSNDAFIGLDRYLRMEGLALRVTPIEGPQNVYIDYPAMTQCLFAKNVVPARTPQRGFLFRHEAGHRQYYDDNALRLFVNYRNAFIRLALYELQVRKDKPAVARTLDTMFAIIPNSVAPMDYRLEYDVATIYLEAGAPERYGALSREIEARSWREIARNPEDISSFYSPYRFLLEMYQQQRKYAQAVAVLDTILKYHPDLEDVRAKRAELQAMAGK